MQISDDTLMALADGELAPELASEVADAVARDPELAARLRKFTETRRLLSGMGKAAPAPAIDPALIARIRAASAGGADTPAKPPQVQVIDTTRAATPTLANINRAPLAMVASICILALVGIGWYGMNYDSGPGDTANRLTAALDSQPTGSNIPLGEGGQVTIISTWRNGAGELCREYELSGGALAPELQVSCHQGDQGWNTRFSAVVGDPGTAYVPAEGGFEELDRYLEATGAMAPMTAEEEASALSALAEGDDRG